MLCGNWWASVLGVGTLRAWSATVPIPTGRVPRSILGKSGREGRPSVRSGGHEHPQLGERFVRGGEGPACDLP